MRNLKVFIKNESLYSLQMYVQFIETLSTELVTFFEQGIKYNFEQNKVSQSYFQEKEAEINSIVQQHNLVLETIEKEIQTRIQKKFPEVITFRKLQSFGKSLDDELKNYREFQVAEVRGEEQTPKEGKVLDLKKSREKRHVKK